jgi:hypothetical protein
MSTVLLPPGVNPTAVKYIYRIISNFSGSRVTANKPKLTVAMLWVEILQKHGLIKASYFSQIHYHYSSEVTKVTRPSFLSSLTSSYVHLAAIDTVGYKNHGCEVYSKGYYSYQVRENQSNYAKVGMLRHAQARTQKHPDTETAYD